MNPQPAASHRPNRALVMALWANAAFLGLIAFSLLSRPNTPALLPAACAQNPPPSAGGAGLYATGEFKPAPLFYLSPNQ